MFPPEASTNPKDKNNCYLRQEENFFSLSNWIIPEDQTYPSIFETNRQIGKRGLSKLLEFGF